MAGYLSVRRRPSAPELFASESPAARDEGADCLEAAFAGLVEHAPHESASEGACCVIVPQETVRRLKRIAVDAVLPAADSNWLREFAESLDGEKLPPTDRAPATYPAEVLT